MFSVKGMSVRELTFAKTPGVLSSNAGAKQRGHVFQLHPLVSELAWKPQTEKKKKKKKHNQSISLSTKQKLQQQNPIS